MRQRKIQELEVRINSLKNKREQSEFDAVQQEKIDALKSKLTKVSLEGYGNTLTSLITHIGNHPDGGQPFGKLAEVQIWGIALDSDEIEVNSKTVLNGYEPGLFAYYPMSEGNDKPVQEVADRSPQNQTGQVQGAVSWFPCTALIGNVGHQAKMFNGQSDFVDLGNPTELNFTGAITLSAWIKPFSQDGVQNIVAHGYTADAEVSLRISNGQYQVGSWNSQDYNVTALINPEDFFTWVHLAGVYDGTNWILYRNGKVLQSQSASKGAIPVKANWAIGASGGGNERFFEGEISEVSIWNRALSAADIQAIMQRHLSDEEPGLKKHWRSIPTIDAVICTEYTAQSLDRITGQK